MRCTLILKKGARGLSYNLKAHLGPCKKYVCSEGGEDTPRKHTQMDKGEGGSSKTIHMHE